MKKTTIKASLMLEDTAKFPLMCQDFEITSGDYKKGMAYVYEKIQTVILSRLTVMIDEKSLKEFFE